MDAVVSIQEFKQRLKSRGYAEKTIESYSWGLDRFKEYLKGLDITDLRQVNHRIILDYQSSIMKEPLAMESKAVKIRPVKRLFEYLTQNHRLLINPCDGIIETCRTNRKVGIVLSQVEVIKLLDQPNLSLRIQIRDRAVMEVLYSTGIRADELVSLKVYDPDLKDKVLYIRKGKGRKQRIVPLGKNAVKYLREYLNMIRPRYAKKRRKARSLFLTRTGDPLTAPAVRAFLKRYRKTAGIKKHVTPHTFRRTCATHMLQQGADVRYVQELLGHRHLRTTQQYTKIIPVDVKKIHNQSHPNQKKGSRKK